VENDLRHDRWLLRIGAYEDFAAAPRGRRVAMLQRKDTTGKRKESNGYGSGRQEHINIVHDSQERRDVRGFMSTMVYEASQRCNDPELTDEAEPVPVSAKQANFIAEEDDVELVDGCVTDMNHFLVFQR
jgi:hypothetical protein